MRITYLEHSGFVVEYEDVVLIFDYFTGELPVFDLEKKIYVFSSHVHPDHFVKEIFDLAERYSQITYLLSDDIKEKSAKGQTIYLGPHQKYSDAEITVETLRSTDKGVAFLVSLKDKVIYHAGDLHWWHWEEEGSEYNDEMRKNYQEEIGRIEGRHVDVAFVVLDPRLNDQYDWGLDYYMRHTQTEHVFPMHMWREYQIVEDLIQSESSSPYRDRIIQITDAQQIFEI